MGRLFASTLSFAESPGVLVQLSQRRQFPMRLIVPLCVGSAVVLLLGNSVNRAAAQSAPSDASAPADEAVITVYHPKQFWAGGSVIEFDGLPVVELAPGEYVGLRAAPGTHVISAHGSRPEKITVDAKPRQNYFIKAWLGFGIFNSPWHLALVAAEKASKEISCCHTVSPAAWIVPDFGMHRDETTNVPLSAGDVLVAADWIPNAGQEGGWAIYQATIAVDTRALHIDVLTDTGAQEIRIPLSAIASAGSGHDNRNTRICWVTVRRTSGHVDEIRTSDCTALYQFGENLSTKLDDFRSIINP